MNVLAFSDFALPEGDGGVERTLDEVYPRMRGAGGVKIRLLALSSFPERGGTTPGGVPVTRIRRWPLERLVGLQASVSFAIWREAVREVRRDRPDVIHAHTLFFFTSLVALAVASAFRVPLVLTVHVGSTREIPFRHRVLVGLYERTAGFVLLRRARKVICVSNDVAAHARALGASSGAVTVIPNGVDSQRFSGPRSPSHPPVVLCVGRLIANKAPGVLLEAGRLLRQQGRDFRIQFAGSGPQEDALRETARKLGLAGIVEFLGPREDVADLLAAATVFVRPSLTDGMSLALIEAMASGAPVVATRISGARELIEDGTNGLLVPPGDALALALSIGRVLSDSLLATRLGLAARERVRAFEWQTVADRTREVLESASR